MISGYDMAPTCDLDMKNYSMSKTSKSESKISNIWPTFRHVWDMSKTFPTKIAGREKIKHRLVPIQFEIFEFVYTN